MIGELLDFAIETFACQGHSSDNAKLVTILSDGRGIFSEGTERVTAAVRRAKLLNIFLVFIIVDNPLNKVSSWKDLWSRATIQCLRCSFRTQYSI